MVSSPLSHHDHVPTHCDRPTHPHTSTHTWRGVRFRGIEWGTEGNLVFKWFPGTPADWPLYS